MTNCDIYIFFWGGGERRHSWPLPFRVFLECEVQIGSLQLLCSYDNLLQLICVECRALCLSWVIHSMPMKYSPILPRISEICIKSTSSCIHGKYNSSMQDKHFGIMHHAYKLHIWVFGIIEGIHTAKKNLVCYEFKDWHS